MKAAVLENKKVITYKDVPTPEPGPGHMRLKIQSHFNLWLGHKAATWMGIVCIRLSQDMKILKSLTALVMRLVRAI